jgi:hypothetical protein
MTWMDGRVSEESVLESASIGLVVNLSSGWWSRHWLCVRKLSSEAWLLLDSKLDDAVEMDSLELLGVLRQWKKDKDALLFNVSSSSTIGSG